MSSETVPYVFTAEELIEYFASASTVPDSEEIDTAAGRLGRNLYPAFLTSLDCEGLLTSEAASVVVPAAWSAAEFPGELLDAWTWRSLFDLAGYTVEGKRSSRPAGPIQLWRGSPEAHRFGWSWTDDRDQARWFAGRPHHGRSGVVWSALMEPARLLARISEQRSGESEYVVDTSGLDGARVHLFEVS